MNIKVNTNNTDFGKKTWHHTNYSQHRNERTLHGFLKRSLYFTRHNTTFNYVQGNLGKLLII